MGERQMLPVQTVKILNGGVAVMIPRDLLGSSQP